MNLEEESLMGLKLLRSEDNSSLDMGSYKKHNGPPSKFDIESKIESMKKAQESSQPGYDARMRKRKLEQQFRKRGSREGTSMEAILIATSSFNTDEDGSERISSVEISAGHYENASTSVAHNVSIMNRVSNIFRRKKIEDHVPKLEPVRTTGEDDSLLSYESEGFISPVSALRSFRLVAQVDMVDEEICSSINTDDLTVGKRYEKKILKGDKYDDSSAGRACALLSPESVMVNSENRPIPIKTYFESDPISRRLHNPKTDGRGIRHSPNSSNQTEEC